MLGRRGRLWATIKPTLILAQYLVVAGPAASSIIPANTTRWNNDVLMLVQRLRRWPTIKTSLLKRVVSWYKPNDIREKKNHPFSVFIISYRQKKMG